MSEQRVPSNGSLLVQPDGSVRYSGISGTDATQLVSFDSKRRELQTINLSEIAASQSLVLISPTPPPNPSLGELWWNSTDGRLYIYYTDEETSQWVDASPSGGTTGGVAISTTPPPDPQPGNLWWNPTDGRLYIWYQDAETAQWVDASPNGGSGGSGFVAVSTAPPSSPSVGDLWWNTDDGRLYIWYIDSDPTGQWVDTNPNGGGPGSGSSTVSVGPTPPSTPRVGQLWWNSEDGRLYVWYEDADPTGQWVDTNPNGGGGGTTTITTISDTPPENPIVGNLWWNNTDGRFYIYYVEAGETVGNWVDTNPSGGGPGQTTVTISSTPPVTTIAGSLWWNNTDGRFYIYYVEDGETEGNWVDTNPNSGGADMTALQQQITDLEARIAALEGN